MTALSLMLLWGVLMPGGLYLANKIRFAQKKEKMEAFTGVEIKTTWKKHKKAISVGWLKWFSLIYLLLLMGQNWIHPDMLILSTMVLVISIVILYLGIKGLNRDFNLEEFVTSDELMCWCEDGQDYFWFNGTESMLLKSIKHGEYIPMIQETIPMIHERYKLICLLERAKAGELTESEQESVNKTEKQLQLTEIELGVRWEGLLVAIGSKPHPGKVQAEQVESLKEIEELLGKEGEVPKSPIDPALKELYALTDNPEVPSDIKTLASTVIRDIEEKLSVEERKQKDELIRMSAEATIKTSQQYHGLLE